MASFVGEHGLAHGDDLDSTRPVPVHVLLSNLPAAVLLVTEGLRVSFANKVFCEIFGLDCSPDQLRGLSFPDMVEKIRDACADPSGAAVRMEEILARGLPVQGEEIPLNAGRTCLRDFIPLRANGKSYGHLWYHLDITENKRALEASMSALAEKKLLLREVNHRVRNNLASIISFALMEARQARDEQAINAFRNFEMRIRAMALLHEDLYPTQAASRVNAVKYLHRLAEDIAEAYGREDIQLNLDIGPMDFNVDLCVPCGLLVTELLTNALKHAFPQHHRPGSPHQVTVRLQVQDNLCTLTIRDNGVGLPKDIDVTAPTSLGLLLATNIVEHQLGGKLDIVSLDGTSFIASFPLKR